MRCVFAQSHYHVSFVFGAPWCFLDIVVIFIMFIFSILILMLIHIN